MGNLVLSRQVGQTILIGDPVHTVVRLIRLRRGRARIGIESDGNRIIRGELADGETQAKAPGDQETPGEDCRTKGCVS